MPHTELNAQAQAVLDELAALGARPVESLTPEQARAQPSLADGVRALMRRQGREPEPEEVGEVQARTLPGPAGELPVRVYRPKLGGVVSRVRETVGSGRGLPVLIWIHGGGWVTGSPDSADASARALANRGQCVVASVGYRRGPEHPFPAAHDDVFAATRWVMDHAAELDADPERVAIGGESAGATLATATCLAFKREDGRLPLLQALVYPVTDLVGQDYPSYSDSADAKPLTLAALRWFVRHALADPGQAEDVRVSPLLAPAGELVGMPPAIVITAASDPLRDQAEAYAVALMDAGVHTTLTRFPGVMHGFFGMEAVLDAANLAVTQTGLAVRAAFEGLEPAAQDTLGAETVTRTSHTG